MRYYTVITSAGRWGKGETPEQAAKNAGVTRQRVQGTLYHADPRFIKSEIDCTDLGGTEWTWADEFYERLQKEPLLRGMAKAIIRLSGKMRMEKGKLVVEVTPS